MPQFALINQKCYNYYMKTVLTYIFIILILICHTGFLGALELEVSGGLNNFTWKPEKTTAGGIFEPHPFILGKISVKDDISKAWGFEINVERDNILLNSVDFRLKTMTDYFGFEFGVFTGINDGFNSLNMGILGALQINWPGILFVSISGSSTVGSRFELTGNDFRESAELKIGFMLPVVIPVLYAGTKSFTEETNTLSSVNKLDRFGLSAEFYFTKTSPFSFSVNGGYQILTKTYYHGAKETVDELSAIFTGLDFQLSVSKHLRFMIGAEMPIVVTPTLPLKASEEFWTMFKVNAGFNVKFF